LTIIKNHDALSLDPFNPNYTPDKLFGREREITEILEAVEKLSHAPKQRPPSFILASGEKSVGKTATFWKINKELQSSQNGVTPVFLRPQPTIRESIGATEYFHGRDTPRSTAMATSELIKFAGGNRVFLCLDDCQRYDMNDMNDFLKWIYDHCSDKVLICLITNIGFEPLRQKIKLDVQSRMRWAPGLAMFLGFRNYDLAQTYKILLKRAKDALEPTAIGDAQSELVIREIAKFSHTEVGDLRKGIELLRAVAERSKDKLRFSDLDAERREAITKTIAEDVGQVSFPEQVYFLAAAIGCIQKPAPLYARHQEGAEEPKATTGISADETYEQLCRSLKVVAAGSTHRWRMREHLQSLGLLHIEVKQHSITDSKGIPHRGRTTVIFLQESPKMIVEAMRSLPDLKVPT